MYWQQVPGESLRADDPQRIGPFTVVGRIGAGGMGRVYLCRSGSGLLVAVKTIRADLAEDPAFRLRFGREVEAARKVGGVYTAPVVDADPQAGIPWMATEYVPAPSLQSLVEQCGPFPARSVRWLAAGIAEALTAIHRAALVHRDLKPANVLIGAGGPKVIDFGISRAEDQTLTRSLIGTPSYMSPEQINAPGSVGPPSDVFSLGSVLVFAATGRGPFGGGGWSVLHRITDGDPDLSGVPDEVRDLIAACLDRTPAARPAPAEIIDDFAPLLRESPSAHGAEAWLPPAAMAVLRVSTKAAQTFAESPGRPAAPLVPGGHGEERDRLRAECAAADDQGNQGDASGALDAYQGIAERAVELLGPDHPEALAIRLGVAYWMDEAGRSDTAAELAENLLQDLTRVLGPEQVLTLHARHILAGAVGRSGDEARAAELAADLVPRCVRVHGPDDPMTLQVRQEHAQWTGRSGATSGAAALLDALIADRVRVLGADHPQTLATRSDHAFFAGAGDNARGVRRFETLVADCTRALGPWHELTLSSRAQAGSMLGRSGDAAGAARRYEGVVADATTHLGAHHPDTLAYRQNHAHWTGQSGDAAGAVALFTALLSDLEGRFGADDVRVRVARQDLDMWRGETRSGEAREESPGGKGRGESPGGKARRGRKETALAARLADRHAEANDLGLGGEPGEAARRYAALVEDCERSLGPADDLTLAARHQLAHWTGESGHPERAVELFDALADDRAHINGADHEHTAAARAQLAHWHGRAGRAHEAYVRYQALYEESARRLGPGADTTLDLLHNVAHWLHEDGRPKAAIELYDSLVEQSTRHLGARHPITVIAQEKRRRSAQASAAEERATELRRQIDRLRRRHGHIHYEVIKALLAAATELSEAGAFGAAADLFGELAADCSEVFGEGDLQTLSARLNHANFTGLAGDPGQAIALLDRLTLDLRRSGVTADDPVLTMVGDIRRRQLQAAEQQWKGPSAPESQERRTSGSRWWRRGRRQHGDG